MACLLMEMNATMLTMRDCRIEPGVQAPHLSFVPRDEN
jgi:hypothetical protein